MIRRRDDQALSMLDSYPDFATSSPSSSVGVCSDPCREAVKIGSVPTDGGGGTEMLLAPLQSLSQREGWRLLRLRNIDALLRRGTTACVRRASHESLQTRHS